MTKDGWIWVVAGGVLQLPMIRRLKEIGYNVVVSDINPKAPGASLADSFIILDTYDVDGHLNTLEAFSEPILGILTVGADVGPTVSAMTDYLGLPGADYETAVRCRDKGKMRDTLKASHPVYILIDHDEWAAHSKWKRECRAAGIEPYPCVVKPLEGSGSRGVTVVESPYQWGVAQRRARIKPSVRTLIVEEMLRGPEYSYDYIIDSRLYNASASYRMFHKFGIEAGHISYCEPSHDISSIAREAAKKLGVTTGPFKVDIIIDDRYGPVVMETATRLSGGFDHSHSVPIAVGKDVTGAMIEYATTGIFNKQLLHRQFEKYSCVISPEMNSGVIKRVVVNDDVVQNIDDIILTREEIRDLENCADRSLFVISSGNSPFGALKKAKRVVNGIRIEYER